MSSRPLAVLIASFLPLLSAIAAETPPAPSTFGAAVDAEKYPSASAPDEEVVWKWDFSAAKDHRYTFEQTSDGHSRHSDTGTDSASKSSAAGDLIVRSAGDGTARLVMENVRMKSSFDVAGETKEMSHPMPTSVLGQLREDGSLLTETSAGQTFMKFLFPLPPRALKLGEVAEIPIEMPFNANGSMLAVKGSMQVEHAGWVMVGKRRCIELRGHTTFAPLEKPEEVPGTYAFDMNARFVFFFDPIERRFVRGVIALKTTMSVDISMPTPAIAGEPADEAPNRFAMSMASEDLITLTAQ